MIATAASLSALPDAAYATAFAADTAPVAGEKDKCPVCGMFVAPYPGLDRSDRAEGPDCSFF